MRVYTNTKMTKFIRQTQWNLCYFKLVRCSSHILWALTFYFHWVLHHSKDILITVNFVKEVKFGELHCS